MTFHLGCPSLPAHVAACEPPRGQGEQGAGREWETEAKVRAEDYLGLSALPAFQCLLPALCNVRQVQGPQEGSEGSLPQAPVSQTPGNPLNRTLRELPLSLIYGGGICSLTRESDLSELPREQGRAGI